MYDLSETFINTIKKYLYQLYNWDNFKSRSQSFKVYFHLNGQFFDLNGRMGYIVNENQFMESKLNYVLAQMLEKHNPDFDIAVSIEKGTFQ